MSISDFVGRDFIFGPARNSTLCPSFFGTPLIAHINERKVNSLIVCGESTSGCVRASVLEGHMLGKHISVVEECVFDRSEIVHKVNLFDMHHKYADVMKLEDVKNQLNKFNL